MSKERLRYVVDASVGIKLFIDEPFSDETQALFRMLAEEPGIELFVPDLFFVECTNVLLKYMRRFGRGLDDTRADVTDLLLLDIHSSPTVDLIEETLVLADEKKLSAYDACYAVLAKRLDIPLITVDLALCQSIEWAVWLGNLSLTPPLA